MLAAAKDVLPARLPRFWLFARTQAREPESSLACGMNLPEPESQGESKAPESALWVPNLDYSFWCWIPGLKGKVSLKGSILHHLFYQYPPLGFPPQYESWKTVQYPTYDINLYDLISRLWTCSYLNLWCMCTYHCNYIHFIVISTTSVHIDGYR